MAPTLGNSSDFTAPALGQPVISVTKGSRKKAVWWIVSIVAAVVVLALIGTAVSAHNAKEKRHDECQVLGITRSFLSDSSSVLEMAVWQAQHQLEIDKCTAEFGGDW